MALAGALCVLVHAVTGFTNKSLRGLVAGQLGDDYSTNQMTYDLRRLRLHGVIERSRLPTPTSSPPRAFASPSSIRSSTIASSALIDAVGHSSHSWSFVAR